MSQTLAKRIGIGFFVVILVFIISFLNTLYSMKKIENDINRINSLRVPTAMSSKDMLNIFNRGVSHFQNALFVDDEKVFDSVEYAEKMKFYSQQIELHLGKVDELSFGWTNSENKIKLAAIKKNYDEFVRVKKRIQESKHIKGIDSRVEFKKSIIPLIEEIRSTLHEMSVNQKNLLESDITTIMQRNSDLRTILYASLLLCLLLALLFSFSTVRAISRPLAKINNFAKGVTDGNFDQEIEVSGINELVELTKTLVTMQMSIKELTEGLESEKMKLEKEDWIKSNYANIVNKLQGINGHEELAEIVLSELTASINSPLAVFYVKEKKLKINKEGAHDNLVLVSSYAYKKRKGLSSHYKVGEGLVGQCARERKIIHINQVPEDYLSVESGLGSRKPESIIVLPIMYEGDVLGVLEFAMFADISPQYNILLEQVANNIGVIIDGISGRITTELLLKKSQEMGEELQQQQEELKSSNEELEEQSQALKQSEEELRQQTEELQSMNEELEEKTESLERQKKGIEESKKSVENAKYEIEKKAKELQIAGKYKSEFLSNMSHELRTPLNSLLLLSKFLMNNKSGNLTTDQIEDLGVIYSGGNDLLNLINDILDLSKVESGKMTLDLRDVGVAEIFSNLKNQFTPLAKQKNFDFKVTIPLNLQKLVMYTDTQRVEQILKNFLSNSFKFTKEGFVELSVEEIGDDIKFSVTDTGIGIAPDKKEEIFMAFQQADGSTSRKFGGTGLGLTISREMSKLLHGEAALEISDSTGSTFTLRIPRCISDDTTVSQRGFNKVYDVQEKIDFDAEPEITKFLDDDRDKIDPDDKIMLIVEDDSNFAKFLLKMSREKGYKTVVTDSGVEGLKLINKFNPSAVLLDIGLPDMQGLKVLERIKENKKTRHIPVHIVSGQGNSMESLQKGAIGHLNKPVDLDTFEKAFSKIEAILSSTISEVLVVEDDEIQIKVIKQLFDESKINLSIVKDGQEALEKLQNFVFDCVILDLNLKGMQGLELLKQLRSNRNIKVPPIVINTSRDLTEDETKEINHLANRIVVKSPHSSERLLDEVSLFLHTMESSFMQNKKSVLKERYVPEKLLNGKRVLLVDDDMRNTFALSKVLQDIGLDVVLADNGEIAIDKLFNSKERIDAVIMDIMMPVMDGYDATKEIRKHQKYKDLPIIALTAKAMPEDRKKCIDAGCNDYLTKPVEIDQLVTLLKVLIFYDNKDGVA